MLEARFTRQFFAHVGSSSAPCPEPKAQSEAQLPAAHNTIFVMPSGRPASSILDHVRRFGLFLSLLVGTACSRQRGPTIAPPPPPATTTSAVAAMPAPSAAAVEAPAPSASAAQPEPPAPPLAVADGRTSSSPLPAFEVEPLYLPGQLARPVGKMQASIVDEDLARWNQGGSSDPAHPSNRLNYHPAPRVVVDVGAVGRTLPERAPRSHYASVASLQAEARNQGYWPFRLCFEQAVRAAPELNGQVRLRLRVAGNGRAQRARLASATLANRSAVDCVLQAASSLVFRKPPSRRVDVDVSVKFWPGDARLPPRSELAARPWSSSAISTALGGSHAELARCCSEALARDPKVWGRLAFELSCDPSGRVIRSPELESRFPDREASECMRRTLLQSPALPTPIPAQFVLALRCGRPPVAVTPPPEPEPSEPAATAPAPTAADPPLND
ncbi:MAG: AgmX/PglI C-terminal domain-containing protein [Polyangiaceae bacterium]